MWPSKRGISDRLTAEYAWWTSFDRVVPGEGRGRDTTTLLRAKAGIDGSREPSSESRDTLSMKVQMTLSETLLTKGPTVLMAMFWTSPFWSCSDLMSASTV